MERVDCGSIERKWLNHAALAALPKLRVASSSLVARARIDLGAGTVRERRWVAEVDEDGGAHLLPDIALNTVYARDENWNSELNGRTPHASAVEQHTLSELEQHLSRSGQRRGR